MCTSHIQLKRAIFQQDNDLKHTTKVSSVNCVIFCLKLSNNLSGV